MNSNMFFFINLISAKMLKFFYFYNIKMLIILAFFLLPLLSLLMSNSIEEVYANNRYCHYCPYNRTPYCPYCRRIKHPSSFSLLY